MVQCSHGAHIRQIFLIHRGKQWSGGVLEAEYRAAGAPRLRFVLFQATPFSFTAVWSDGRSGDMSGSLSEAC